MLKQRVITIKEALGKEGISQGKVAKELDITSHAIWAWVHGRMASQKITEWFGNKFGQEFLKQIEIS